VRNATLSALCALLLGSGTWVSVAAAQTDDLEDDAELVAPAGDNQEPAATATTEEEPAELPAPSLPDDGEADAEEAPEAAEEEAPAPAPAGPPQLAWRNTFFSWTNQVTFNSFIRGAQLTYDPLYQQVFNIAPRWYLAPQTYFLVSQTLSLELTDSNFDARNRDPQLSDTVIEFRQMFPWEGFMFMGQARIALPLSKASQAAQRYMQMGLGLTIVRPIPEANLTLAGIFAYRGWLAGSNVVQVGTPQPDRCAPLLPPTGGTGAPEIDTTTCDQVAGPSAARDTILAGLAATLAFDALTINLQAFMFILQGYGLAPAYINVATSPEPVMIADGSPSHWRNFTFFSLSVGYQFNSWLNLSLGIQNSGFVASAWNPDGSVRSPFNPDTQAFLSATIQIDSIYTELQGSEDDGLTPEERQRRRQGLASGPSTGVAF
jgi:hypothetical protein